MSQNWFGTTMAAVSSDGSIGDALMTGLTLIVVVFAALCALSLTIWLFGRSAKDGNKATEKKAKPAPVPATAPKKPAPMPAPVQTVSDEEDGAVAAAIAAAVAMLAPAGVTYRVKKITPVGRAARSAWAAAAIHQNTAPF